SIVDFGRYDPAIDPVAFPSTPVETFWSSSPSLEPHTSWCVDFRSGNSIEGGGAANITFRARCVRSSAPVVASSGSGGPPPGRYTVNAGTVTDALTGLVWLQAVDDCSYTQADAIAHCASLTLGGSSWRLPLVSELLTLVDTTQQVQASVSTPFSR